MDDHSAKASHWKRLAIVLVFRAMTSKYLRGVCRWEGGVLMLPSFCSICIKSTRETNLSEAHAMEFVSNNTSIPVPKVYQAFERKGRVYIVMEKIKAANVGNMWSSLSQASRERIFQQLRPMIEELRTLQPPKGMGVANVDGGPIFDPRLPTQSEWGPFGGIDDFHKALVDHQDIGSVVDEDQEDLRELAAFYRQTWHQPVFTHGDLSSFNILCEGDKVVGIIDWETAGWLPAYWEYTTAWNANPQNAFWQAEVDRFLQPLPHARAMDSVRRKYFGFF
ncbi:hypothetical protein D0861_05787 [Hortaea werneckii]|uniref:Aminoglycoside phosphotransferase domain-containing protein n=1 Tax=Hortaea werneckii TaxID=91943 RepID=A0A3M7FDB6_HORWE|nr:hypothetical protein D0861_05787 [Hortaea werneckii]